jgi:hypothetical protein
VGQHVYPWTVGRNIYPWTVEWGDMFIHGLLSGATYLSVDCWVGRHVYPRTVEWGDMSIRGLLSGATCLSTDCWVGWHVYPWTVEWGDMSTRELLFGWASTIQFQLSVFVLQKADLIIISLQINLFSPWYSWKIVELALNNNYSIKPQSGIWCFFVNYTEVRSTSKDWLDVNQDTVWEYLDGCFN